MGTLKLYHQLSAYPLGKRIFSYLFCKRLPYFFSIKPLVIELKEGRSVVQMQERRSVHNHLRSVHAIALCNLCEAAMAIMSNATIPDHLRFIPIGMTVSYKKKANGTLRAIAEIDPRNFQVGKLDVPVNVFDQHEVNVMSATITLDIKLKK